jgi:hypothetical protein
LNLFIWNEEAAMPAWLEVLVNLAGYAGFLALATNSGGQSGSSNDDHARGGKT